MVSVSAMWIFQWEGINLRIAVITHRFSIVSELGISILPHFGMVRSLLYLHDSTDFDRMFSGIKKSHKNCFSCLVICFFGRQQVASLDDDLLTEFRKFRNRDVIKPFLLPQITERIRDQLPVALTKPFSKQPLRLQIVIFQSSQVLNPSTRKWQ